MITIALAYLCKPLISLGSLKGERLQESREVTLTRLFPESLGFSSLIKPKRKSPVRDKRRIVVVGRAPSSIYATASSVLPESVRKIRYQDYKLRAFNPPGEGGEE